MTVVTMILTVVAVCKTPSPSSPPTRTGKEWIENENVQIPYDLFVALLQYHLMMDGDYEDEIKQGLERKTGSYGKT